LTLKYLYVKKQIIMGQILQSETISKNEINGSVNVIDNNLDLTCENNRIINQYLKSCSKKKIT